MVVLHSTLLSAVSAVQAPYCCCYACRVPVGFLPQHPRRRHAEMLSSPSTSEDESAPSTSGSSAAPLLQRSHTRRFWHEKHDKHSTSTPTHTDYRLSQHQRQSGTSLHPLAGDLSGENGSSLNLNSNPSAAAGSVHSRLPPLPPRQEALQDVMTGHGCQVVGLMLLHPSVAGEVGPSFTRLLGRSR